MSKSKNINELENYFLFYILWDYYLYYPNDVQVGFHETGNFLEIYFNFKQIK